MIDPSEFVQVLRSVNINFFCGVPDSLLQPLCKRLEDHCMPDEHIITANEGNSIALATGYHLGTGNVAMVYMQNSGLGNAVNPLVSLAHEKVYRIPMLLVIGWRGEPGKQDEPQHQVQGSITEQQLKLMDIPFLVVEAQKTTISDITYFLGSIKKRGGPAALLIKKGVFKTPPNTSLQSQSGNESLTREFAIEMLLGNLSKETIVVATTGKASRELFEVRKKLGQDNADFLTVGSMGHASSIALGIAITNRIKPVIVIDGDGSLLMHMGALPVIAGCGAANVTHVILNNGCHESVGGQPTVAGSMDLPALALACGYRTAVTLKSQDEVVEYFSVNPAGGGPSLVEIMVNKFSRADLSRPDSSPIQNKTRFMQKISHLNKVVRQ